MKETVKKLQVFGDSLVVINWINKTQRCRNTSLDALFEEVSRLITNFQSLSLKHVYREWNMDGNKLSKEGIYMEWGTWKFTKTKETEANEFYHRPFMDLLPGQGSV